MKPSGTVNTTNHSGLLSYPQIRSPYFCGGPGYKLHTVYIALSKVAARGVLWFLKNTPPPPDKEWSTKVSLDPESGLYSQRGVQLNPHSKLMIFMTIVYACGKIDDRNILEYMLIQHMHIIS